MDIPSHKPASTLAAHTGDSLPTGQIPGAETNLKLAGALPIARYPPEEIPLVIHNPYLKKTPTIPAPVQTHSPVQGEQGVVPHGIADAQSPSGTFRQDDLVHHQAPPSLPLTPSTHKPQPP